MDALERLVLGCVLIVALCFGSYRWGLSEGQAEIQAKWDQDQADLMQANGELIAQHAKEIGRLVELHQQANLKNTYDHQNALEKVRADLAAARAESQRLGGLRITVPAPACPASDRPGQGNAGTQTTGAGEHHAEAATTIALPEQVEASLWSIVGEASEVVEQARACQAWIIDNGFYGKNPAPAD